MCKQKNKNILCLGHFPPPQYGVTRITQQLVDDCLNGHYLIDSVSINSAKRMQAIGAFGLHKVLFVIVNLWKLVGLLCKKQYALCYVTLTPTGIGFLKDFLFVFIVKCFRVPLVFHLHGKGVAQVSSSIFRCLYHYVFRNVHVIVLAHSLYSDIEAYVPRSNVYILPNGVEDVTQQIDGRTNEVVTVLCVANMFRSKGVMDALRIIQNVVIQHPEVHMVFAGEWGDIGEKDFFAEVKACGLESVVSHLGFIDGDEKRKVFQSADIFLYPTHNDAFPLVILEAMQYALPTVATNEGAIPEMIEDSVSGYICEKGDLNAFVKSIEELILDPRSRGAMGEQARDRYLKNYTLDIFKENVCSIMKSISDKV